MKGSLDYKHFEIICSPMNETNTKTVYVIQAVKKTEKNTTSFVQACRWLPRNHALALLTLVILSAYGSPYLRSDYRRGGTQALAPCVSTQAISEAFQ